VPTLAGNILFHFPKGRCVRYSLLRQNVWASKWQISLTTALRRAAYLAIDCCFIKKETSMRQTAIQVWRSLPKSLNVNSIALLLCIGLAACGGGGGGSGGGDPAQPPGGGGNATPSGTVWHNSTPSDVGGSGSKIAQFSGNANRLLDRNLTAVPNADGQKFLTFEYDASSGSTGNSTTLRVKDTVSGSVVRSVVFKGYVRDLRPSPLSSDIVLVKWSSTAGIGGTDIEQVVVDLAQRKTLDTLGGTDVVANWLGDGRYLLLQANGNLLTATPGGTRTAAGRVFVDGRSPSGLWVSPLGNQIISEWRVTNGTTILKDLWISDLNGGALDRLTNSGRSGKAVWSQDAKFVSYEIEPESVCTGFSCGSPYCFAVYAPSSSRNLTDPDPRAVEFRIVSGADATKKVVLGCDVRGWTN
jgi:hypothetical protein